MFFRKAKEIKRLNEWLDEYAKQNQKDKRERKRQVEILKYKLSLAEGAYRFKEENIIAALMSKGIENISYCDYNTEKFKDYNLDITTDLHGTGTIRIVKKGEEE